jgi:hypothetical protein
MKARLILRRRRVIDDRSAEEAVVWRVPVPVPGSVHSYKYRLAFIVDGVCVLRFDNERGKGDHKHVDGREEPYVFTELQKLLADFRSSILEWEDQHDDRDL